MTETEAYPLIDHDYFDIHLDLPVGATIVGVDLGEEHPRLLVQNRRGSAEIETRVFRLFDSGEDARSDTWSTKWVYVGAVEVDGGPIYIYEVQVH